MPRRDPLGRIVAAFPHIPLHQQVIAWAAKANIDLVQLADNYFPLRFVRVK